MSVQENRGAGDKAPNRAYCLDATLASLFMIHRETRPGEGQSSAGFATNGRRN